jgi:hypothetical protein
VPLVPQKKVTNPKQDVDARLGGLIRRTITDRKLWLSLAVAFAIAYLGDEGGLRKVSEAVGTAQSQVGVAVAGVVLASLAVFIVFLDADYVELLDSVEPGVDADLEPFLFTMVVASLTAACGVWLIAVGDPIDTWVLRLAFGASTLCFNYLLFVMCELVWLLARHMRRRVRQVRDRSKRAKALAERTPR